MSTYLYIHCEDCDEWSDVIGRNTEGEEAAKSPLGLKYRTHDPCGDYMIAHMGHKMVMMTEYQRWPETPPWKPGE